MKSYPYRRVFIGFALAPAIGGIIIAFSFYFAKPFETSLIALWAIVPLTIFIAFIGTVFFIIPSSLLAVVYAFLKLQKNWKGYLFTTVMGGVCSVLWDSLWFPDVKPKPFGECYYSPDHILYGDWDKIFLLGAISSFVMSCFVLPSKRSLE